ncbi:MAG: family lipolytic protein [Actinomycetia bacterium]|nr:family lipolytic protein [Actinomycetes bacterium]MDQ1657284.1 15-cis-phytoene synthase [Cryptosporangiaceae bacterium]
MTLRLAILGDSIAYGIGAARSQDNLAHLLAADLAAAGVAATPRVFAVPGARSSGLAAQVRSARAWHPDLAVIVIGANDLTRLVPPAQAAADLGTAVRELRAAGTETIVAPAPDLSVIPHVPPALRGIVQLGSARLREAQAAAVRAAGGRIADPDGIASAAFARDPALFSADRFHPSSAGYAVIAAAVAPAVRAAVAQRRTAG